MPTVEYYGDSTTCALCIAPPEVCLYNLETFRISGVPEAGWLDGAIEYVLELWAPPSSGSGSGSGGGSGSGSAWEWQEVATVENPGEAAVVENFLFENGIKARWKVLTGDGTFYSGEVVVDTFCCYGSLPPAAPEPPELVKNCEGPVVAVTSPEFSQVEDHETTSVEIRRRIAGADDWQSVHTFTAATTWNDETVEPATDYEYQARACNDAGCSDWSESATISLKSSTTVAIISPATGMLSGKKRVRISSSGTITNPRLYWNGVSLGNMSLKDGVWIYDWDTMMSSQGVGVLKVTAVGADGCLAVGTEEFELNNPAVSLQRHVDIICREGVAGEGKRIKSVAFQFQAEPLPVISSFRSYVRVNAYTDDLESGDPFSLTFDEDTWLEGQPLSLEKGRVLEDGTTQWHWYDRLRKPGAIVGERAIFRIRWDAAEVLLGHSTLGTDSRIVKMRDVGEGDSYSVVLLAVKEDSSEAVIYGFDGNSLSAKHILSEYDAANAFDFAVVEDKVFVATPSKLLFIDEDSGDVAGTLWPNGETRSLVALESYNGALFAFFSDDSQSPKTRCYRWSGSWQLAWSLDEVVTGTAWHENGLIFSASNVLYTTTQGTATPTLVETFVSPITAMSARFVGLQNGKLYELVLGEWVERAERAVPINAVSEYSGVTSEYDDPRGVAGEGSFRLLEATINPAVWSDSRELSAPSLMIEDVDSVTALHRYFHQTSAATGDPNTSDYVPAQYREILMIGTGPDGLLLTLEVSNIANNPLAVPATKIGCIYAAPIHETVPEED